MIWLPSTKTSPLCNGLWPLLDDLRASKTKTEVPAPKNHSKLCHSQINTFQTTELSKQAWVIWVFSPAFNFYGEAKGKILSATLKTSTEFCGEEIEGKEPEQSFS